MVSRNVSRSKKGKALQAVGQGDKPGTTKGSMNAAADDGTKEGVERSELLVGEIGGGRMQNNEQNGG